MPTVYEDFANIAAHDPTHRRFRSLFSERWFKKFGIDVLIARDLLGRPLTGVALRRQECPLDRTADVRIYCWVADVRRAALTVDAGLAANVQDIRTKMIADLKSRVWGAVPRAAGHLTAFLDPVALAGKCARVDGRELDDDAYEPFIVYVGDRDEVADHVGVTR